MNRRRFLSYALVPLVPVAGVVGMDWTSTAQPVFATRAEALVDSTRQLVAKINAMPKIWRG